MNLSEIGGDAEISSLSVLFITVKRLSVSPRYFVCLILFRAGSERFDSGRGGGAIRPPSDLKNQASERQAANGVG